MRSIKSKLLSGLTATIILGCASPGSVVHAADDTLRWGTSTLGAGSQVTLAAIITTIDEATSDVSVQEQITGGPTENVRLLSQGNLEIAQTTTNVAYDGFFGRGAFESTGPVKMYGLLAIYPANCTLAVALDSSIESVHDLAGKRVSVGPPAAGITVIMEAWLEAYGVADEANIVKLGYTDGTDALRAGTVDATLVFGVGGAPVGYLQELDLSMDILPLGWDVNGPAFEKLQEQSPEMTTHGIFSSDLVKHLDRDIQVPTTYSAEYISPSIPEETVYQMMKVLWENRDEVKERAALGGWIGRDPKNMLSGLHPDIPVHPGAARFYKEIGVWDDRYTVGE